MDNAWRPDIFEQADADVAVYQFGIEGRRGYKHIGLPPGIENPN